MNYVTELAPYLEAVETNYQKLLRLLSPYDVAGQTKLRIGPAHDGGYVMLDPGRDGIAYSFGISDYSPWDLEMANRGFKVYQYDGTVPQSPDEHPNIIFTKANISGAELPPPGEKNVAQILREHSHESANTIILQIDIEGAEWEFFEHITQSQLEHFSQIIVEFHGLFNIEKFDYYINVIKKLCKTHCPVHIHYNNYGDSIPFTHFIACDVIEVSFIRRDDLSFQPCTINFPTALDSSNNPELHDIIIGNFSCIAKGWEEFVQDKVMLSAASAERVVYLQDAQKNQLNCIENQQQQIALFSAQLEAEKIREQDLSYHLEKLRAQNNRQERTIYRLRHPWQRLMSHLIKK